LLVVGWAIAGETITLLQTVGAILVMAGIFFAIVREKRNEIKWLAFLNTVRTERVQEVLSLKALFPNAAA
jgi:hypothetical protein